MSATERDDILDDIRRVASQLDKDWVTRSEYKRHGRFGIKQVMRTFLRWNDAIRAAGLSPIPPGVRAPAALEEREKTGRITDEELRAEFMRVYGALGKVPTMYEFANTARFSTATYATRFGSWRKTVAHYLGSEVAPSERAITHRSREVGPSSGIFQVAGPITKGRRVFGAPSIFGNCATSPSMNRASFSCLEWSPANWAS